MTLDISPSTVVPHDGTMVLLDSILSHDKNGLVATVLIRDGSLFLEAEGVPAWIGLEYMGQAIAAYAGINARQENKPVQIGFLVSARRYEPSVSHFPIGSDLTVEVISITDNVTGLSVFECSIRDASTQYVTANLNVYLPDDAAAFMRESSK